VAIDLMSRFEIDQITVDMICQEAGIGRSTFYNHFRNLDELVREHFSFVTMLSPSQLGWVLAAPSSYEKILRVHLAYIQESAKPKRLELYKINLRWYLANADKKHLDDAIYMKELLLPLIKQGQNDGEISNKTEPAQLCSTAIILHWANLFLWTMSNGEFDRVNSILKTLEALYLPREDLKNLRISPPPLTEAEK
jgi:AcrR family transcriptional regulator